MLLCVCTLILKPVRNLVLRVCNAPGTNTGVHKHSPFFNNFRRNKIRNQKRLTLKIFYAAIFCITFFVQRFLNLTLKKDNILRENYFLGHFLIFLGKK